VHCGDASPGYHLGAGDGLTICLAAVLLEWVPRTERAWAAQPLDIPTHAPWSGDG